MSDEPSPMLAALERGGEHAPPDVHRFDRLAAGGASPPDFYETSPQAREDDDPLARWRLSYYFDVTGAPSDRFSPARRAHARLERLCGELEMTPPAPLLDVLRSDALFVPALAQVGLGADVRERPEQTRLKYYAILEAGGDAAVARLCDALGAVPPAGADLSLTHIVGIDLTRAGLHDVKLYWTLALDKVARTLRDPSGIRALLVRSKTVVLSHSLLAHKRSLHFQVDSPQAIWDALGIASVDCSTAASALSKRTDAINARPGPRLAPWIIAYPYAAGALDRERFSVYFHLGASVE